MLPAGMGPDDDLLSQAKYNWRKAYSHWRRWRTDAKEDYNFVAGSQWSEDDKQFLMRQGRPTVCINRTAVFVDAVSGAEVQNRQELRYIPREMGDVQVNEALTAAAKYFRDQCDAEDEESAAFYDCLVSGVGITETRMDFDDDPDGTIVIERIDPFEVFWDPAAKRANMMDAKFMFRTRDMSQEEVIHEWGQDAIDTLTPGAFNWGDVDDNDEEPHETIHGRQYELGKGRPGLERRRKYRIVEYQWKEWAIVHRTFDPMSGQEVSFDSRRWKALQKHADETGVFLPEPLRQKRITVKRAFFLGDTVLEQGDGPCPTDFTYKAITGHRDRNHGTWYGIVRPMKDPQRWANKFFSQILHIINSNAKGGLLAEMDAFDDARDAETRWAESDSIIWMQPGGVQKIAPKPMPGIPSDIPSMMEFCVNSLRDVTGINLELLGMQTQEQPGILEYQRKQAGLTILATLFDSLRRYRKEQGRVLLYFIQTYIPAGRLVRIEGPVGAQFVQLEKQPDTARFDVVVDEAPSSPNLKEQVFAVLQTLIPQLVPLGMRIPMETLEYLPLPDSLIQAFRRDNSPQQGQGQQQPADPTSQAIAVQAQSDQMKTQAQVQRDQADNQLKQAQLQADQQLKMLQAQHQKEQDDRDFNLRVRAQSFAEWQAEMTLQQQAAQQLATMQTQDTQRQDLEQLHLQNQDVMSQALGGVMKGLDQISNNHIDALGQLQQGIQGLGALPQAFQGLADQHAQGTNAILQAHQAQMDQSNRNHQAMMEAMMAPEVATVERNPDGTMKGTTKRRILAKPAKGGKVPPKPKD